MYLQTMHFKLTYTVHCSLHLIKGLLLLNVIVAILSCYASAFKDFKMANKSNAYHICFIFKIQALCINTSWSERYVSWFKRLSYHFNGLLKHWIKETNLSLQFNSFRILTMPWIYAFVTGVLIGLTFGQVRACCFPDQWESDTETMSGTHDGQGNNQLTLVCLDTCRCIRV